MKITDFVQKGNRAYFSHYRAGFFYYNVASKENGNVYQFQIPLEELAQATLNSEEPAITLMRYIRASIQQNTFFKINTKV